MNKVLACTPASRSPLLFVLALAPFAFLLYAVYRAQTLGPTRPRR